MRHLLLLIAFFLVPVFVQAQTNVPIVNGQAILDATTFAVGRPGTFRVLLTTNVTFSIINGTPGQTLNVLFLQDNVGSRTVTFATNITTPCSVTAGANAYTNCGFSFDSGNNTWSGFLSSGAGSLSGQTPNQVPIAATATTSTSSKAIQGTETNLLSSDGSGVTGAEYCQSASGGATTNSCTPPDLAKSVACSTDTFTATPIYTFTSANNNDQCHIMTLSGNVTSITINGTPANHTQLFLKFPENGVGGFTVTFPGNFVFPTGFTFHTVANNQNNMGWTFDGANWRPTVDFGGGGGGGGTPPTPPNFQAQVFNNGLLTNTPCFNVSAPGLASATGNLGCDTAPTGPNPSADIRAYGGRILTNGVGAISAPITCVAGTNQAVIGTVTNGPFLVGDYVFAGGCGAPITVATPAAPTVVSGNSRTQTVPDALIVSNTGTNTDAYLLVTKDNNGGLTLPSAVTTITTAVSLGQQTASVTSVTSAGQTLTISLGSTGPANGTLFHLSYVGQGATQGNHKFDGYYNVCSGGNTSTITVCNMPFFSNTTDSTAAIIYWFNGNKLTWTNQSGAWAQYVCGKRVGDSAFHFLGSSIPQAGSNPPFTTWVDWGPTLTPSSPTGLPEGVDSICTAGTAQSDYLDNVKITACNPVGCGSGSTLTLSGNMGTSKSSTVLQDSAPALTAANAANVNAGVGITIPCLNNVNTNQTFFFSPQYLTSQRNWIDICGTVGVFETIDVGNVAAQFAMPLIGRSSTAASNNTGATVFTSAYPAFNNVGTVRGITFSDQTVEGISLISSSPSGNITMQFDSNKFGGGISSIGVLTLGIFPFGFVQNSGPTFGPGNAPGNYDQTWTPWFYADGGGELRFSNQYGFGRGIYINNTNSAGPTLFNIDQYYIQGAIMPEIGVYGAQGTNTSINLTSSVSDTSPQPIIDFQTDPLNVGSFTVRVKDQTGLPVNLISGWSPLSFWDEFSYGGQSGFAPIAAIFPDLSTNFGRIAIQTTTRNDSFNRASIGSNWVNALNGIVISNNQLVGTTTGTNIAFDLATTPLANSGKPTIQNTGQFCDVSVATYSGSGGVGCTMLTSTSFNGFSCQSDGATLQIQVPNQFGITAGGYTGGGPGDHLYGTAFLAGSANASLTCTVFPQNGPPFTISGTSPQPTVVGYPGVVIFGQAGIADNFTGGTLQPIVYPNLENNWQAAQHFPNGTVGNMSPIPGALPDGWWSATSMQSSTYSAASGPNDFFDNFNQANGTINAANWTAGAGTTLASTVNNQVSSTGTTVISGVLTGPSYGADQFARIVITGDTSGSSFYETILRRTTVAAPPTQYSCTYQTGTNLTTIQRFVAGTGTTLAQTTITWSPGDIGECDAVGPVITLKRYPAGTGVATTVFTVTDTAPILNPGFVGFAATTGAAITISLDNFSGGNYNPQIQPTVETDFLQPFHEYQSMTIGNAVPIVGALPYGSLWVTTSVQTGSAPPNCTAGTAGMICISEGTNAINVVGADLIDATSSTHELSAATGGDTNLGMLVRTRPLAINQTGQAAAISTATLCASTQGECAGIGQYHVHVDMWGSGTPCATPGPGGTSFLLTWTDENATVHSAVVVPLLAQTTATAMALQSSAPTFPFQTALGAEGASGDLTISTNGSVIQYATSYTACTTGTGTYNLRAAVTRLQ